jgi:hypothetical protein
MATRAATTKPACRQCLLVSFQQQRASHTNLRSSLTSPLVGRLGGTMATCCQAGPRKFDHRNARRSSQQLMPATALHRYTHATGTPQGQRLQLEHAAKPIHVTVVLLECNPGQTHARSPDTASDSSWNNMAQPTTACLLVAVYLSVHALPTVPAVIPAARTWV